MVLNLFYSQNYILSTLTAAFGVDKTVITESIVHWRALLWCYAIIPAHLSPYYMPIISLSFVLELAYVSEMTKKRGICKHFWNSVPFPSDGVVQEDKTSNNRNDSVWCQCFAEGCDGFLWYLFGSDKA